MDFQEGVGEAMALLRARDPQSDLRLATDAQLYAELARRQVLREFGVSRVVGTERELPEGHGDQVHWDLSLRTAEFIKKNGLLDVSQRIDPETGLRVFFGRMVVLVPSALSEWTRVPATARKAGLGDK